MNGVGSSGGSGPGRREQLIGALIPPVVRRSAPPVPLVAPMLPAFGLPTAVAGSLLLDVAALMRRGGSVRVVCCRRWGGGRGIVWIWRWSATRW